MVLDDDLEERIAEILRPLAKRWPDIDMEAIREGNRKQATIPAGSAILEPVGTAPGVVVEPLEQGTGPTVVVLPGPPRELQPMWGAAIKTPELQRALSGATVYSQHTLRLFGIPESEIAETLREAERRGVDLESLEVTTCLKRGEVEVVTRYEPSAQGAYEALEAVVRDRHADTLFSDDGSTVDVQVARLLRERAMSIATAESCTGGMLAARLTDLAGSSDYMRGGDRRLLERGEDLPGRGARRADRAARRRFGRGRRGPGAGSPRAPRRRCRRRHHRRRRPRRRNRGEARRPGLAVGRRCPAGAGHSLGEHAAADGRTCASARRPSPCTWCAAPCSPPEPAEDRIARHAPRRDGQTLRSAGAAPGGARAARGVGEGLPRRVEWRRALRRRTQGARSRVAAPDALLPRLSPAR